MRAVDTHGKEHVSIPDYASSCGGIKMTSTSYKEALISLGQTNKFIDNCLQ